MAVHIVVYCHRTEGLALQNVENTLVLRTLQDAVWSQGLEGADYQKKVEAGRTVCHHNMTIVLHMQEFDPHIVGDGHSFEKTGLYSLRSRICMWAAQDLCWLVFPHRELELHRSCLALCLASGLCDQQLVVSKHDSVSSFPQDMDPFYIPLLDLHATTMMALGLLALCELPLYLVFLKNQLVVSKRWKELGWAPPV